MPRPLPTHLTNQVVSPYRRELINMLSRMAVEAEAQFPGTSRLAPWLHDLVNRAAAAPERVPHDWEAIARAAFGVDERSVVLMDAGAPPRLLDNLLR